MKFKTQSDNQFISPKYVKELFTFQNLFKESSS
jgi:hypothetical protein